MNFKHICSTFVITTAVLAAISCKKDEDSETKPSLTGLLRFKGLPEYIAPGSEYDVTPAGISHPEKKPVGYFWKQTPRTFDYMADKNDTSKNENGSARLKFKDSLYTCTVTCGAFADGYYNSTATAYATTVKGGATGGSVTRAGFGANYGDAAKEFFPVSDEINDEYTVINGYKWKRRNLSSVDAGDKTAGIPFRNCEDMDDVFGRYYTYDEARTACPTGWTLPDDDAWKALGQAILPEAQIGDHADIPSIAGALMADALFNADVKNPEEEKPAYLMWEYWPEVDITNSTGLSVLPVGYANGEAKSFINSYIDATTAYAAFITGDEPEGNDIYFRYIKEGDNTLYLGKGDRRSFAASVRCVQKIQ